MIVRELQNIKNPQLKKAILALKNYNFIHCYIDSIGGCDIAFGGKIPEEQIQKFFECLGDNEPVQYNYDYIVYKKGGTSIFTKDGWKY